MLLGGRYQLIALAGQGGMAEVWRAEVLGAAGFRRPVAIKRVLPNLSHDAAFRAMFIEEARVTSMLDHPNVVQVFDFGEDRSGLFLAMEWVEGMTLRDLGELTERHGARIAPGLVVAVGVEILRALEAAHSHTTRRENGAVQPTPIIHRDISPSNVLLSQHGAVKLADFGLARALDRAQMTPIGIVKGKIAYLPPERARGTPANEQSDLYSCGVVLWELACGRRLYHGRTDGDIMRALIHAMPHPPAREVNPQLPPALATALDRALAIDPAARFGNAAQFAAALADAQRELPERYDAGGIAAAVTRAVALRTADAAARAAAPRAAREPADAVEELGGSSLIPLGDDSLPEHPAQPPPVAAPRRTPPALPAPPRVPRPKPRGPR